MVVSAKLESFLDDLNLFEPQVDVRIVDALVVDLVFVVLAER